MSLTVATEAAKVRRLLGGPDMAELTDADLQAFYTSEALDWLNRRRPGVAIGNFTTVANQQDYSEKPSNAYRVTHVWWLDASWLTFSPSIRVIPGALDIDDQLAGVDVMHNPAIVTDWFAKIRHYDRFFKGHGRETEEGKIRLVPEPGSAGDTVYFAYTYPRWSNITSTPDEYVLAARHYVAHLAAEYLFIKRGFVRSGKNFSGGGGANEDVISQRYLQRAEALTPEVPAITIG